MNSPTSSSSSSSSSSAIIGILILAIVGILVYFLVLNKKDCPDVVCPKCPEKGCPDCPDCPEKECPSCPEKECPKCADKECPDCPDCPEKKCPECPKQSMIGGVFGFPVKPGNEITDFLIGIEEEFKPIIHGMICGILDKVLKVLPEDKNVKCSELVRIIEKLKNTSRRLQRDNMYQEFTDRHRVFEIIQEKLDILYDKLYKRVCKTEDGMVNGKDAKRIIEDFKNHVCDGVKSINLPKRKDLVKAQLAPGEDLTRKTVGGVAQKAKVALSTKASGYKVTDRYSPDGCIGKVIASTDLSPGARMDTVFNYKLPKDMTACCVEFKNANVREMEANIGANDSVSLRDFKVSDKNVIDLSRVVREKRRGIRGMFGSKRRRLKERTLCADTLSIEATPLN